jgi:hypothetical protein
MRILDQETDRPCSRVTIYLKRGEAEELRDSLEALLDGDAHGHEHVSDAECRKELTLCLYDDASLDHFDARSRTLIERDA